MITIQDWINSQLSGKRNDAPTAPVTQAMFVRDRLQPLFCHDLIEENVDAHFERIRSLGKVMSTHLCHSRSFGVFDLDRPDVGLRMIMRGAPSSYGSTNWKMSVISNVPIRAALGTLCETHPSPERSNRMSPHYFEGFPEHLVFGYYGVKGSNSRRCRFSLELYHDYMLWAAIHMILVDRGLIKNNK